MFWGILHLQIGSLLRLTQTAGAALTSTRSGKILNINTKHGRNVQGFLHILLAKLDIHHLFLRDIVVGLFRMAGIDEEEDLLVACVSDIKKAVDDDGDGEITKDEFVKNALKSRFLKNMLKN